MDIILYSIIKYNIHIQYKYIVYRRDLSTVIQNIIGNYSMSGIQTCSPMVPKSGRKSDRTAYRVHQDSSEVVF